MTNIEPRFAIGTQFTPYNLKNTRVHTIVDFLRTYNNAGELVKTCYETEHEFLGQTIRNRDVTETLIARSVFKQQEKPHD